MESRFALPGMNNGQILGRTWSPSGRVSKSVVAVHGLTSHSGWFSEMGKALSSRGVALFAADRRGSGMNANPTGALTAAEIVDDVRRVIELAASQSKEVTLLCWCWGAKPGLLASVNAPISRVLLAAPGLINTEDVAVKFKSAVAENGFLPLPFDQLKDFSDLEDVRSFIAADHLALTRLPVGVRDVTFEISKRALDVIPKLSVPAQCILGAGDKLIDNAAVTQLLEAHGVEVTEVSGGHAFILHRQHANMVAERIA